MPADDCSPAPEMKYLPFLCGMEFFRLVHWDLSKMADIFHMVFSDALSVFCEWKYFELQLKFYGGLLGLIWQEVSTGSDNDYRKNSNIRRTFVGN